MKYELWRSEDDLGGELTFFPVNETYERQTQLLEPGAELIWTVEADSYNEAMRLYYEHMDWGPYKPMDDD
jgi:hypothetical protein